MGTLPMPFSKPSTYPEHSGVDFGQPRGTAIRASGPGVVLRTSHNAKGGYWTVIRYDAYPADEVGYAHQDQPVTVVKAGQRVVERTVIGHVGSTGTRSTGPHLHVEVLNRPGYANAIGIFDTARVVGQATPASNPAPAGDGDEFMAKIDDLWQQWLPGQTGVKTAGAAYVLFVEVLTKARTAVVDTTAAVWAQTVSRDGKKISALQELADAKTLSIQTNAKLDELLKRPAAAVTLTDAQVDQLAAKVGEKVALSLAPAILDQMSKRLAS